MAIVSRVGRVPSDWLRTAWASEAARTVWEPRLTAIAHAWRQVEVASVRAGVRRTALVFGAETLDTRGLQIDAVTPGRWVVSADGDDGRALVTAYRAQDNERIGQLLGFPACCRTFFDRAWTAEGRRDTTLAMALSGTPTAASNILGRWMGVRLVPHLPCGFGCVATADQAQRWQAVWPEAEVAWATEILSWPVQYSALHGIAEITFPVVKLVAPTDYTPSVQVRQLPGTRYPDEAPTGLGFPFQRPNFTALAGLKQAIASANCHRWEDNGFPSAAAMTAAHAPVIAVCPTVDSALDIGSGNGLLLQTLQAQGRVARVLGFEADRDRVSRALVPTVAGVVAALPRMVHDRFDLALIAQRRLIELTDDERTQFWAWATDHLTTIVVYSYDQAVWARAIPVSEGSATWTSVP